MDGTSVAYDIYFKIFHSIDWGIPQSRERVYVVGVRARHKSREFHWPTQHVTPRSLTEILDLPANPLEPVPKAMNATHMKNLIAVMDKMKDSGRADAFLQAEYVRDLGSSRPHSSLDKCMPLTKSRCSSPR